MWTITINRTDCDIINKRSSEYTLLPKSVRESRPLYGGREFGYTLLKSVKALKPLTNIDPPDYDSQT